MSLTAGTRLGPYEVQAPLGAGGMGEVYRARDTRLDRTVAIKVLPTEFAGEPTLRERFDREARLISSLNHPHICALFDVGQQDEVSYLVIEYLEGETLASRLEKGRLKLDPALQIAVQIAGALDAAHRAGVVHRDIKPGNVMLTRAGAKLLDFGLARTGPLLSTSSSMSIMPTTPAAVTSQGAILGTLQYMSPEQLDGSEADARSDVFAFGALVYEMVTGRRAFEGKSQASLIAAIMSADPPPMATLQPVAPAPLDRVIRKCLAKDPDERWQSARDLADELTWIARAEPNVAAELGRTLSPTIGVRSSRERIAWIVAGSLAAVATAALLLGYLGYLSPQAEPANLYRTSLELPPGASLEGVAPGRRVALSPDGRMLAFVAAEDYSRERHLWVRRLDSLSAQVLPGTEGANSPFWSPNSRYIAFVSQGRLRKVDVTGGPPITLTQEAAALGGSWNRDDVILFVTKPGPLFRISASGGGIPEAVTVVDKNTHSDPFFLPDGRRFLFEVTDLSNSGSGGIYIGDLQGQQPPKRLLAVNSNALMANGHLLFLRDRTLMAQPFDDRRLELAGAPVVIGDDVEASSLPVAGSITVSTTGALAYRSGAASVRTQLVWYDRGGKRLSTVGDPTDQMTVSLSPDGSRAAVSVLDPTRFTRDLSIVDLERKGLRTRFTFDPADEMSPVWTHDGREIIFASRRSGRLDLFKKPASGVGAEVELYSDGQNNLYPTDVSRDGKYLLFFTGNALSKTANDLWLLPLTGEAKPQLFLQTSAAEFYGTISPDGRWIAFSSSEAGRPEIWVASLPNADSKWQVSRDGGNLVRWRGDSKELFFIAPNGDVMAASVDGSGTALVTGELKKLFESNIRTVGFAGSNSHNYDVTPDGQRFLIAVTDGTTSQPPTTLLVNWTSALRP
jgi:serine/threonine protein kinase